MSKPERFLELLAKAEGAQHDDRQISLNLLESAGKFTESCLQLQALRTAKELIAAIDHYCTTWKALLQAIDAAESLFAENVKKQTDRLVPSLPEQDEQKLEAALKQIRECKQ